MSNRNQQQTGSDFRGWQTCDLCRGTGEALQLLPRLKQDADIPRRVLRHGSQRGLNEAQRATAAAELQRFLQQLELEWEYEVCPCRACRGRGGRSW